MKIIILFVASPAFAANLPQPAAQVDLNPALFMANSREMIGFHADGQTFPKEE